MWKCDDMEQKNQVLNTLLVKLFNDILKIEEKALTKEEIQDISVTDMHIIEAIGCEEPKSMSSVAKIQDVTVGTLTTAINSLVKKGYVKRERGEKDKRVVLISLTQKGKYANAYHEKFHEEMIQAVMTELNQEEIDCLNKGLSKINRYFEEKHKLYVAK